MSISSLRSEVASASVDHRAEHAHVVAGDPVAALGGYGNATEDIATAHDNAHFNTHLAGIRDIRGNPVGDVHINPEALIAHQSFARGLQKNALVEG